MKTSKSLYSRLALITSVTLVVGYFVVYAAWTNLDLAQVQSGEKITSTLMQNILNKINDIGTRTDGIYSSAGNIGVGTASPSTLLHINDTNGTIGLFKLSGKTSGSISNTIQNSAGIDSWQIDVGTTGYSIIDGTKSSWRMVIDNSGRVGIGTTTPGYPLHVTSPSTTITIFGYNSAVGGIGVYGQAASGTGQGVVGYNTSVGYGGSLGTSSYGVYSLGPAGGTSSWVNVSDQRLKTNIEPVENALKKILSLRGVTYRWRDEKRDEKEGQKIGLIAQQVEKVFPQVIHIDHSVNSLSGGTKMIAYSDLISPVIQAIRELYYKWLDDSSVLHNDIASIKAENATLKSLICLDHPNAEVCK